jgi:hypothetical protein
MGNNQTTPIIVVIVVRIVIIAIHGARIITFVIEGATPTNLPGSLTDQSQHLQYTSAYFQN